MRSSLADLVTGGGAVWLPRMSSVRRVDEGAGNVRVLRTRRLGLGGFQHDVAVGHGSLWALSAGRVRSKLLRFDSSTGHRTGEVTVRGIADAVVVRAHAVWVATTAGLYRFDRETLRQTLRVAVD